MPDTIARFPSRRAGPDLPPKDPQAFAAWLDRTMAGYASGPRHDSCRRHEPDSPESIYLRGQAEKRQREIGR